MNSAYNVSDINKNVSVIKQLQKELIPLQGLKKLRTDNDINLECTAIESAFPNASFPIGCTHEFITNTMQDAAATNGFITALLSKLVKLGGACLWISASRTIFPAALIAFNINPEQIIFIDLKNEKDVLYATEEGLKCNKLIAVIADIRNISFKASRRFQLAAEQSRVTGFIIRNNLKTINTIASVSRWQITCLPSELPDEMPGVGFSRWKVELQKIRNGTPSNWVIEWRCNNFNIIQEKEEAVKWYDGLRMIS